MDENITVKMEDEIQTTSKPQINQEPQPSPVPQWEPETRQYYTEPVNTKKLKKKKEKKPATMGKVVAVCALTLAITLVANAAISFMAFKYLSKDFATKSDITKISIKTTSESLADTVGSTTVIDEGSIELSKVVEAVMPSVVAITSTSIIESTYNPFYYGGSYQVSGAGSGIIIGMNDTELLIVTNNHVVEDTTSLTIQFCNDESIEGAYIKGTDSVNDLAVVALPLDDINDDTLSSISIASLGDSDSLQIGESVIAIGNALGYGQSVTKGIVSALDRTISLDSGDMTVIQTDAAINGGNSGGALLNLSGEVVGINVAKTSSSSSGTTVEGMGYAIPVSQVKDIIDELMNRETRFPVDEKDKGYLGINYNNIIEVDSKTSDMYRIPVGIYIRELDKTSALVEAGIKEGSVITKINGTSIKTWESMIEEMSYYKAGETVTVTVSVMGNGKYEEKNFEVTLKSYDEIN